MSDNVRKRVSKWDRVSEPCFSSEMALEDVRPPMAGEASCDESIMGPKSLEDVGSELLKWPNAESNKTNTNLSDLDAENGSTLSSGTGNSHVSKWSDIKNKDHPKESGEESAPRRDEWGDINVNQGSSNLVTTLGQYMSPTIDVALKRNRDISPKGGWSRSRRSRSKSRSRSRSWSRSRSGSRDYDREKRDRGEDGGWDRIRSMSRSPVHSFKRGSEGWSEKRWTSGAPCRDFAAGRCKRGADCRYLHEDGGRKFYNRHHDVIESGEDRYERGKLPGYHSKEHNIDSVGQRDYLPEKAPHGRASHYGGDWQKPEPHRSGKGDTICHDFRRGRCQRGSTCRYIHHNASADSGWEVKGWTNERLQDEGDVKVSFHPERKHEFRRASDTPCKFFLEGRCRNGDKCRFSHQGVVQNQPDGMSCDLKSVENSDNENKITWNGPTWDNQEGSVATPNVSGWQRDDRSSRAAAYATVAHKSDPDIHDQQFEYAKDDSKYLALPKQLSEVAIPAHVQNPSQQTSSQQNQHVPKFSAQALSQSVFVQQHSGVGKRDDPLHENNSIVINTSILRTETDKASHEDEMVQNSRSQNEANFVNNLPANPAVPSQSTNLIGQSQYANPQPSNEQGFNLPGQNQQVVIPLIFSSQSRQTLVSSLATDGQTHLLIPQMQPRMQGFDLGKHSHQLPPPSFSGQTHQSSHSMPSNQQNQFIAPQLPPNVNYSSEKQSQYKPSPPVSVDNQMPSGQGGQLRRADNIEMSASQTNADTITQRVVSSEQVTQLSNLSAPLSQIFGNGPELPQLYAALNPCHGAEVVSNKFSHPGCVSPLASTTATYVQPIQGPEVQHLHCPISDNTYVDNVDTSVMTPGLSSDPIEQRNTTIGESQTPLKTLAPLQSTDGTVRTADSENNHGAKQVDMNGDNESNEKGTVTGLCDKEQQTVQSDDANANVQVDGASNRNKDAKGARMFRFALVELVKDILRPTWKEGQMSKEAHKTIVKKVVDKVISTLDTNIPQTQERIDLYLSYSKEKLTKLVQAYVEKYLKA